MKSDSSELTNVAADPINAARLNEMTNHLEKRLQTQGDSRTVYGRPAMIGQPIPPIASKAKAKASDLK